MTICLTDRTEYHAFPRQACTRSLVEQHCPGFCQRFSQPGADRPLMHAAEEETLTAPEVCTQLAGGVVPSDAAGPRVLTGVVSASGDDLAAASHDESIVDGIALPSPKV